MPDSVFRRSAVASGLISPHDLEEAMATVRAGDSAGRIDDDRLAEHLIAARRLNAWQVGQLRAGRTTFKLGPYWILDSLGRGRTGDVYKAEHSVMGRAVAIKVLPKRRSSPQAITHFISEIRNQAQLDHKHLVCAYDAGHDRNVHFLVMEYVPGTDLRRLIRQRGKLDMETAADFIAQAAEGLAYAHARGITHRDVKPSNLLITEQRQVKLSDLGLSGLFNEAESLGEQGGFTTGSTDYLAPELIASSDRPTPLSDIYALGCTLYYAVTGKVPFPGGTVQDKVQRHLTLPPRHPRLLNPTLSDTFVEIIGDMMAKDPQQRVTSAEEVIARLAG
ncbi:MAG TPA: serine/threonine-protein kinase [Pirellulales bacterium]|nr:serine/threonine-protein kinase [Pirellulales bacterium]